MSNITIKLAIASLLVLAAPAVSLARGGGGSFAAGHMGSVGGGGFRPNAALIGEAQEGVTDPSGIGNASRMAPLPQPSMAVPAIPQFK